VPQAEVLAALRRWAEALRAEHPETVRAGCFGSYARGDYLPSSDADVFVEVSHSPHARWFDRPAGLPDTGGIPVGVELFVYTSEEVARMREKSSAWLRVILEEAVWL
jgi:predicted nucleotidyltransferase